MNSKCSTFRVLDQTEVISRSLPSIVTGESKTNLQPAPTAKVLGNHKYLHVHLLTAAGKWFDKVKFDWTEQQNHQWGYSISCQTSLKKIQEDYELDCRSPGFLDSLTLERYVLPLLEILNYDFSTHNTNGAKCKEKHFTREKPMPQEQSR